MFSKSDPDMSLRETAKLLDVPEQAVLRWARKGALPCRNVRGEPHFRKGDVERWAKQMGMKLRQAADAAPNIVPNALAHSIRRGGIVDIDGSSVEEALANLVERIDPIPDLSAAALLEVLMARERLASTAVGEGVALPHPRQPLTKHLRQPVVVVARLREPIDWQSLDRQPVSILLLVLSCSLKGHLDMLARIAQTLKHTELREAIVSEPDLETLCQTIEAVPE